ncbi:MAG: hypothetical protein HYX69_15230 [Planctomycetia bacterium]|nr:hypothetical protein [Planctomycetia bacterium]
MPGKQAVFIVLAAIVSGVLVFSLEALAPSGLVPGWFEFLAFVAVFDFVAVWSICAALLRRSLIARLVTLAVANACYHGIISLAEHARGRPLAILESFCMLGGFESLMVFAALVFFDCTWVRAPVADSPEQNALGSPFQFSLGRVFLLTALVAVLVVSRMHIDSPGSIVNPADFFDWQLAATMLALAATWLVLGRFYTIARLAVCGATVAVVTGWILIFDAFVGLAPALFVIFLVGLLLPFRLGGFRIVSGARPRSA